MFENLAVQHHDPLLSRRAAIGALGAAGLTAAALARNGQPGTQPATPPATTPSTSPAPAKPAGPAPLPPGTDLNGAGFYRFKVGTTTLTLLTDGSMPLSTTMFGANASKEDVEAAAAEVMIPPARMLGHVHGMLIDTGAGDSGRVLIDSGCGTDMGPGTGRLFQSPAKAGFTPAQIGAVVITHAHPDHVRGLLQVGFEAFPAAQFFAARTEVDYWMNNPDLSKVRIPPAMRDAMADTAKGLFAQLLEPSLKTRFHQLGDGDKIIDGITLALAPGHTPGHSAVTVTNGAEKFMYLADVAHHAGIQFPHPDWHVAYDTDPVLAAKSRRTLLTQAAAERTLVSGAHLPFPAVGYVKREGSGFNWVPRVWEW